ncbi:MAG: (d)CMP kinase [Clostridia bacterium]|nr:(d)CMP kinase [Clostridia bacterium]
MINIALDGLSGSGKGALADGLAKKLNLIHLDTGAIFRGIACGFLDLGFTDPTNEEIENNINSINVSVKIEDGKQLVYLNSENITPNLRKEEVSKLSSKVSIHSVVREKYLQIVNTFANNYDCIIDGRDITSIVLPNADCKIYLTADENVRAKRRYDENVAKNIPCTYKEVLENLKERDYRDTHRDIAPLIIVPDAFIVDNSNLSIDETIDICYKYIASKLGLEV